MAKALNDGLRRAMEDDDKVLVMGEDVGRLGGVFRVTDGLQKDFGEQRVIDTPLAESAIVGTAIGLAMRGYRPVCEIQFDGFVYPAFDQIVSQLAKHFHRSDGRTRLPVVVRIPFGGGIGAVEHHSESPEAYFAHTAGPARARRRRPRPTRTCCCSRRSRATTRSSSSSRSAATGTRASSTPTPSLDAAWPGARVVREGDRPHARRVRADGAGLRRGRRGGRGGGPLARGVDLRSVSPLDLDTVAASVRRTGRCVVVHEAQVFLGVGAEIAARVTERCFYDLEAPVLRVGGFATPYPASRLEQHYLPDLDRVLDAVDRALAF